MKDDKIIELDTTKMRTLIAMAGMTEKFVREILDGGDRRRVELCYGECHRLSVIATAEMGLDATAIFDDEELESQDDLLTLISNADALLDERGIAHNRAHTLMRGYVSALFSLSGAARPCTA